MASYCHKIKIPLSAKPVLRTLVFLTIVFRTIQKNVQYAQGIRQYHLGAGSEIYSVTQRQTRSTIMSDIKKMYTTILGDSFPMDMTVSFDIQPGLGPRYT